MHAIAKAANDTLHLPGRLQGRGVSKNRNAGLVKCKGWFATALSEVFDIQLEWILRKPRMLHESRVVRHDSLKRIRHDFLHSGELFGGLPPKPSAFRFQ